MLLNNKKQYAIFIVVAVVFFVVVGFTIQSNVAVMAQISACDTELKDDVAKVDCWLEVARGEFDTGGTPEAFKVFEFVYENYDSFANSGCHRHAHRVGDMAYYSDYLLTQDITKVNFPKEATACGYGFYHGFFEHLIQDTPDVEFVTATCEYLRANIEDVAPAIAQTCYHGSGHGFVLAQADVLVKESQWSFSNFTEKPLEQCESLPRASEREISECRQGVYNVIVDWMSDEEYELSYNTDAPFTVCDTTSSKRKWDCYYEMSQKLDGLSGLNPQKMVSIVEKIDSVDLQELAIAVGVAGIVQQNPQGTQSGVLTSCQGIERVELRDKCIAGIVGGLVEHTTPDSEYRGAIEFCELSQLTTYDKNICYEHLQQKLQRFKTDAELKQMCTRGILSKTFCEQKEELTN